MMSMQKGRRGYSFLGGRGERGRGNFFFLRLLSTTIGGALFLPNVKALDVTSYILLDRGVASKCPASQAVPENECRDAAGLLASAYNLNFGDAFLAHDNLYGPCGCFLWETPEDEYYYGYWNTEYKRAESECAFDSNTRLVCKSPLIPPTNSENPPSTSSLMGIVFAVVAVITVATFGVWYVLKERKLKMAQMRKELGRGAPSQAGVVGERAEGSITASFPVPIAVVPNTATKVLQQADDDNDEEHNVTPPVENANGSKNEYHNDEKEGNGVPITATKVLQADDDNDEETDVGTPPVENANEGNNDSNNDQEGNRDHHMIFPEDL